MKDNTRKLFFVIGEPPVIGIWRNIRKSHSQYPIFELSFMTADTYFYLREFCIPHEEFEAENDLAAAPVAGRARVTLHKFRCPSLRLFAPW